MSSIFCLSSSNIVFPGNRLVFQNGSELQTDSRRMKVVVKESGAVVRFFEGGQAQADPAGIDISGWIHVEIDLW